MARSFVKTLACAALAAALLAGCGKPGSSAAAASKDAPAPKSKVLRFSDVGWDSIRFHNAVARLVAEKAFGYKSEEVSGTTPITYPALKKGDIDILMEMWIDNVPTYGQDLAKKEFLELGTNFSDDAQGVYVPRYVIEGDAKRNIKAMAPGLKTVRDLARYKDVFKDPEAPGKGRLYGAVSGWNIDQVLHKKYLRYGLDKDFTYFSPGSDAALAMVFSSAYEKGQAVAGYYWEPTWLTGKYDLVRLQDDPYNAETFNDGLGDFPAVRVTILGTNSLPKEAPEMAAFLAKYRTTSAQIAQALAYMNDSKADYATTAKWFLANNPEVWASWLEPAQVELVKKALR